MQPPGLGPSRPLDGQWKPADGQLNGTAHCLKPATSMKPGTMHLQPRKNMESLSLPCGKMSSPLCTQDQRVSFDVAATMAPSNTAPPCPLTASIFATSWPSEVHACALCDYIDLCGHSEWQVHVSMLLQRSLTTHNTVAPRLSLYSRSVSQRPCVGHQIHIKQF